MLTIEPFFDKDTSTLTYIVFDSNTKDAVVIDPVWDYDPAASKVWDLSVQKVRSFLVEGNLQVHYILETHAHADHLSGAQELKKYFPQAKIAIGSRITAVQDTFKAIYNLDPSLAVPGDFDLLLEDGQSIQAGSIKITTWHTPGHTPACSTYEIGENLFTGDALFLPDSGTGRCDFPKGSAKDLYQSITQKIFNRPGHYRIMAGHDYQPGGRSLEWETTVEESKRSNIMLRAGMSEEEFITCREKRDKTLSAPRLLLPSIQVNILGGRLPPKEKNGTSYLKIPVRF